MNYVELPFQVSFFSNDFSIDYVKKHSKRIEIFKLNKPSEGHYMIMENLGLPIGKKF